MNSLFENFINDFIWLHLIVLCLSIISLTLFWRKIYYFTKLYWFLNESYISLSKQTKLNHPPKSLSKSTFDNNLVITQHKNDYTNDDAEISEKLNNKFQYEKKKIFSKWIYFGVVTNIAQIIASAVCIFSPVLQVGIPNLAIGISCLLTCFNLCSYIEYSEKYSIVYKTIKQVLPYVLNYLFGVLPIFLGFIFFGM